MDQYEEAIYYYQEALKIEEELKDSINIARAIEIYSVQGPKEIDADLLSNISNIFEKQIKNQSTLNNFNLALSIFIVLKKDEKIAITQNLLGAIYARLENFQAINEFIL